MDEGSYECDLKFDLLATQRGSAGQGRDLVEGRDHFDRAVALYEPVQHRALVARFGQDPGAAVLAFRSLVQWLLGHGEGAEANADQALEIARNSGQVGTLMYVLGFSSPLPLIMGNYATAAAQAQELLALAEEKVASVLD